MSDRAPKTLPRKLYKALSKSVMRSAGRLGHLLPSVIHAPVSGSSPPSDFLFATALAAVSHARASEVDHFNPELADSHLYNQFPGEHYRLLKSLVELIKPSITIEIGTFTGMGCFALRQGRHGVIHTFDVLPWTSFRSHLTADDFLSGAVVQHLADLSDPAQFETHRGLLESASIIFLDGPKDGVFEEKMLSLLTRLSPKAGRLLIIDDIRFVNMVENWASIISPKLDMTSFAHWSGTGLVDLSEGLRLS